MGYRAKTWDGSQWIDLGSNGIDSSIYATKSYVNTAYPGRNLIHNGAFNIHQRGTSAASITTSNYYTADRWQIAVGTLGTWTNTIENDAPIGSGFRKSLKMLCTAADASPTGGDIVIVQQMIEGQNLQSVLKGTANALPLTLSFWVKSNVTGTYIASLYDNDGGRRVAAAYTINASATWEKKTITFPADTTAQFDNDNAFSLSLQMWLATGPDYTSSPLQTSWGVSAAAICAQGQVNVGATINNYWQITGIQLETGSTVTPYEHKDFATDLRECQRYYQKSYSYGTVPGTAGGTGAFLTICNPSTLFRFMFNGTFAVPMRTTPTTISTWSEDGTANSISLYNNSATKLTISSIAGTSDRTLGSWLATSTNGAANDWYFFQWIASADF